MPEDAWVSVPSARQAPLSTADKRKAKHKAAAAAQRQARDDARDERVSRAKMSVRQPVEAVDVDALMAPAVPAAAHIQRAFPAGALIQPAIPWAARKRQRPNVLEWLSAPQQAPRHRNIDDWLKDDSQHQPVSTFTTAVELLPDWY